MPLSPTAAHTLAATMLSPEELERIESVHFHDAGHGYDPFGMHPSFVALNVGTLKTFYKKYFRVKSYDVQRVPGHGPVCGVEALDGIEAYFRFVADLAAEGWAAGLTPLELAQQADLGAFADLTDAERLVANLHRAYAEADGTAPGDAIDYLTAFSDMLALNGGGPLRCLA